MQKIVKLEQRGAIQILLYLRGADKAILARITKNVSATEKPVYKSLLILQDLGLVTQREDEEGKAVYVFTDKGKIFADKLIEANKILEETSH